MKIAYISIDDPKDNISWSGLKLNIYKTLKLLKHDIKVIGPLKDFTRFPFVIKREFLKRVNLKYDSERKTLLSKKYSKKIMSEIKNQKIDLIFTSDTYLVSFLRTNIPIILWLDATYHTYHTHYYGRNKIHKKYWIKEASTDTSNQIFMVDEMSAFDRSKPLYIFEGEKDALISELQGISFSAGATSIPKVYELPKTRLENVSQLDFERC